MKQSRKETAWKKNRKFGDVKGGRTRPKLVNDIFNRQHNLEAPKENEATPIFIQDNPSRDFFFPISIEEIKKILEKLPQEHTQNLTHIWLRKINNQEKEKSIQGCFICGSGVNLIVIYPFPKDLKMTFGKKRPSSKELKWYSNYNPELIEENGYWQLVWTEDKIKQYYLEGLFLHEMGHKIDSVYQRYWSKAYKQKAEKFADNFAYYWGHKVRNEIE